MTDPNSLSRGAMQRQYVQQMIARYEELWTSGLASEVQPWDHQGEKDRIVQVGTFVANHADCFERTCIPGHITGSSLVVSHDLGSVLLTLHRKLGAWLQLGGHSDGDPITHRVAMREAREESGLTGLHFLAYEHALSQGRLIQDPECPLPFDFDCHVIPAHKTEPAHIHYDVRFLITADRHAPLIISEESQDLRWFTLAEARTVTEEPSMLRQFAKLEWLRTRLRS